GVLSLCIQMLPCREKWGRQFKQRVCVWGTGCVCVGIISHMWENLFMFICTNTDLPSVGERVCKHICVCVCVCVCACKAVCVRGLMRYRPFLMAILIIQTVPASAL